ncbi:hypothetical protein [Streptomyces sp. NPDC088358]
MTWLIGSPFEMSPSDSEKNVPRRPCRFLYVVLPAMGDGVS